MGNEMFKSVTGGRDKKVTALARRVKIPERALFKWYFSFLFYFPSAKLNHHEFREFYPIIFEENDPKMFSRHVFNVFDLNGDEVIDFQELMIGVNRSCFGTIEEKLGWSFDLIDKDRKGYITLEDFTNVAVSIYRIIGENHMVCPDRCVAEEKAKNIFDAIGHKMPLQMNKCEFIRGLKRMPTVVKCFEIREFYSRRPNS